MNKRPQINVRLNPALYEKFQQRIKDEGWTSSALICKLIESFVKAPRSFFSLESQERINEKLDELNQKIDRLEEQQKSLLTLLECQSNSFALKLKQKDHYLA